MSKFTEIPALGIALLRADGHDEGGRIYSFLDCANAPKDVEKFWLKNLKEKFEDE